MTYVVKRPGEPAQVLDGNPGLSELQESVGGLICPVTAADAPCQAYVNDEGLVEGLPWSEVFIEDVLNAAGDRGLRPAAGPVAVTGPLDEDGAGTPLTPGQASVLAALLDSGPVVPMDCVRAVARAVAALEGAE